MLHLLKTRNSISILDIGTGFGKALIDIQEISKNFNAKVSLYGLNLTPFNSLGETAGILEIVGNWHDGFRVADNSIDLLISTSGPSPILEDEEMK